MWKDIKGLWQERRVHGLELVFDTALLALRYLSLSYWLRRVLPAPDSVQRTSRDNAIDVYSIVQLVILSLLLVGAPIASTVIASYILFELYLNLLNIVFIGKFPKINAPPASVERSILLFILNIVQVVMVFGIFYRDWLGLTRLEAVFKAVLVFGTVGYPEPGNLAPLVALQVFLDVILVLLVLSSFAGQLALFSNSNRTGGPTQEASNKRLEPAAGAPPDEDR